MVPENACGRCAAWATEREGAMPWFQEFASAAELVRIQTRAEGQANPVGQYVAALNKGDTHVLETAWPGEAVVYDPRYGEIRGHRRVREFVRHSGSWHAERHTRVETVASTVAGNWAVVELLAQLAYDGQETAWPVAIVAESPDDRSVVFRRYFSRRVIERTAPLAPCVPRARARPSR
jgi:hypothetical protein